MGRDGSGFFLCLASLFAQAQLSLVVILTDLNFLTFEQSELPRLFGDKRMRAVLHVIILMFEYLWEVFHPACYHRFVRYASHGDLRHFHEIVVYLFHILFQRLPCDVQLDLPVVVVGSLPASHIVFRTIAKRFVSVVSLVNHIFLFACLHLGTVEIETSLFTG